MTTDEALAYKGNYAKVRTLGPHVAQECIDTLADAVLQLRAEREAFVSAQANTRKCETCRYQVGELQRPCPISEFANMPGDFGCSEWIAKDSNR